MRTKHILAAIGLAAATLLPSVASAQSYGHDAGDYHAGYHRAGGYGYGHGDNWRERQRWQHRRWVEAHRRHWQHDRWEHHRDDRNWR